MLDLQDIQKLYDNERIPANDDLIQKLFDIYLSIPAATIRNSFELDSEIYKRINDSKRSSIPINDAQEKAFIEELNRDLKSANISITGMNPLSIQPGWVTIQSWKLLGTNKIHSNELAHRFYIGTNNTDLMTMVNGLYDKFKEAGIPFYFKYDKNTDRRDKIVIYTSTSLLPDTVKVLDSMTSEYPSLFQNCVEPSLILGKLNNNIGYATEDTNAKTSYTDNICNALYYGIRNAVIQYVQKYPNQRVKADNEYVSILDFYKKKSETINEQNLADGSLVRFFLNNPNFKNDLFASIRKELGDRGVNLDNIFVNKRVEQETRNLLNRDNKSNKFNYTFEEVKGLYDNYYLTRLNTGEWVAVSKNDNQIHNIPSLVEKVKFAYSWVGATMNERSRTTYETNVVTPDDYNFAFSLAAKKTYDQMMLSIFGGINTTGNIPKSEFLEKELYRLGNEGKILEHADAIVRGFYSKENFLGSLESWAREMTKNLSIEHMQARIAEVREEKLDQSLGIDLQTLQQGLNLKAKEYLNFFEQNYGALLSPDKKMILSLLKGMDFVRVDTDIQKYIDNQVKGINEDKEMTTKEKEEAKAAIEVPIAHGGKVYEDGLIHFYPSVIKNGNVKDKCESVLLHEIFHYFISPDYVRMSSISKSESDKLNSYVTEGMVDMCTRDTFTKMGIDSYSSNYGNNVMLVRNMFAREPEYLKKVGIMLNANMGQILQVTNTRVEDVKAAKEEQTPFNGLAKGIANLGAKVLGHSEDSLYRGMINAAANCSSESEAVMKLKSDTEKLSAGKYDMIKDAVVREESKYSESKQVKEQLRSREESTVTEGPKENKKSLEGPKLVRKLGDGNSGASQASGSRMGYINVVGLSLLVLLGEIMIFVFVYLLIK